MFGEDGRGPAFCPLRELIERIPGSHPSGDNGYEQQESVREMFDREIGQQVRPLGQFSPAVALDRFTAGFHQSQNTFAMFDDVRAPSLGRSQVQQCIGRQGQQETGDLPAGFKAESRAPGLQAGVIPDPFDRLPDRWFDHAKNHRQDPPPDSIAYHRCNVNPQPLTSNIECRLAGARRPDPKQSGTSSENLRIWHHSPAA